MAPRAAAPFQSETLATRETPFLGLAWATTHGYCSAAMSTPKSLVPLRFSLVGPGRVGRSMAHWMTARGAEIVTIAGRDSARTATLARELGAAAVAVDRLETSGESLLLLTISDPALPSVATQLAKRPQAEVVLHTAGALDASVLEPLREAGCSTGSLHPLMAFPRVLTDPRQAKGKVFALDGTPEARTMAERLALSWDGSPVHVSAEARPIYHLAASLAAGGVVTLLATAFEMASRQGLPHEVEKGYLALARGAIEQASQASDISGAITGPVARGDIDTFLRQVAILEDLDRELAQAVRGLANLTLRFTSQEGEGKDLSEARAETPRP